MFFDPEDSKDLAERATDVFKGQYGAAAYCMQIKHIKMFWIVIHYVRFGSSFHLVLRQVAVAREESKLG